MIRWVALSVLGLAILCGCRAQQPAPASAAVPASPDPAISPQPVTTPAWTRRMAPGTSVMTLSVTRTLAILAGNRGIRARSLRDGSPVWAIDTHSPALAILGQRLFMGDGHGGIEARAVADGRRIWRSLAICKLPGGSAGPPGGLDVLRVAYGALYVGCSGGRVAKLDVATGRVAAVTAAIPADQVTEIAPLGNCSLAVNGFSDGAGLRNHVAVLGCTGLQRLVEDRVDTTALGTVQGRIYFDNWCCNGRPDVYDPATIESVLPGTGATVSTTLRPDPELYPANNRPIGQGSRAQLSGNRLYLTVLPRLYRYDVLNLGAKPERLANHLAQFPSIVDDRFLASVTSDATAEIRELRPHPGRVIWRSPVAPYTLSYHAATAPNIVAARFAREIIFVRVPDGATMAVPAGCNTFASYGTRVVALCAHSGVAPPGQYQESMFEFPRTTQGIRPK